MTIIEEYIQTVPQEQQKKMRQVYEIIKKIVPTATERISYGMPTFYLNGNLVHFANMKQHLGFYPTPSAIKKFQTDLKDYKTSKGAVQFTYEQELPTILIQKMVAYRVKEQEKKGK